MLHEYESVIHSAPAGRRKRLSLANLALATLAVGLVTTLSIPSARLIEPTNLVMLYLATVVSTAYFLGRAASLWASLLSVLAFDFWFIPPYGTFAVAEHQDIFTFSVFSVIAFLVSGLTGKAREQAAAAQYRQQLTQELFELSKALGRTTTAEEVRSVVESQLTGARLHLDGGANPDLFPESDYLWLPLNGLGVLGAPGPVTSSERKNYLQGVATLATLALERSRLAEEVLTERLQRSLLNSISHDLRIPLVSITGALSSVQEEALSEPQQAMVANALQEAQRLNRLVGNLLQVTRIEAGVLQLTREANDVADLIATSLDSAAGFLGEHPVTLEVAADLPLVEMDFVLMQNVLLNLLENAAKVSPPGSGIEISAQGVGSEVEIAVSDRGPGVPKDEHAKIFQRFYKLGSTGTGLGLSICQGLVEAHRGRIWVEDRPGAGAVFRLRLPA